MNVVCLQITNTYNLVILLCLLLLEYMYLHVLSTEINQIKSNQYLQLQISLFTIG